MAQSNYGNRKGRPTPKENKAAKATPNRRKKLPRDLPPDIVEAYVFLNKNSDKKYSVADAKNLSEWYKENMVPKGKK